MPPHPCRRIVSVITSIIKTILTSLASQDTNIMQYDLMRYIASPNRCLTIVGDPDQSSESPTPSNINSQDVDSRLLVYGWRAAEVQNLAKMQRGEMIVVAS